MFRGQQSLHLVGPHAITDSIYCVLYADHRYVFYNALSIKVPVILNDPNSGDSALGVLLIDQDASSAPCTLAALYDAEEALHCIRTNTKKHLLHFRLLLAELPPRLLLRP